MAGVFDGLRARRGNVFDGLSTDAPQVTPEEQEFIGREYANPQGEFTKGLRRAAFNASDTTDAFIGQMAEPFAPDFAARQFQKVENSLRTRPGGLEQEIQSFRDVDSVESAASFASGALGEGITSVAGIVAGGLAARFGLGTALRLGATGKNVAQYGGGVAAMLPQEAGETALTLRNNPEAMANTTPLERTALSLGKGTIASAMESIVPNLVFTNAIAGTARRIAAGGRPALANVGRKAVGGAVGEFATEGAQELTGQAAENIATGETGYDFEQAMEAAVRGAITGGVLGGAGGTVQAARSNIDAGVDAAREAAGDVDTDGILNAAVEKLDNLIRNPEEVGADLTNTTLGALAEASSRARDAGEAAGPAAAKGMDVINGLKRNLDRAIGEQLTPENKKKYAVITDHIRLLEPTEFNMLRDALETGDAKEINLAVGDVVAQLRERVPRETFDAFKKIGAWSKKFGKGVTRAARERKAAFAQYTFEDQKRFLFGLEQLGHGDVIRALESGLENPAQLVKQLMVLRDSEEKLNLKDNPAHRALADGLQTITGKDLSDIVFDAQQWRNDNLTAQDKKAAYNESTGASQIAGVGERAENLMLDDVLQAAAERDGVDLSGAYNPDNVGLGTSTEAMGTLGEQLDKAGVRRDDDELMNEEDTRRTPYNSLGQVQRILGADIQTKVDGTQTRKPVNKDAGYTLPSTLRIAEVKDGDGNVTQPALPPAFIGQMLGGKESRSKGYENGKSLGFAGRPMRVDKDTVAMRTTEDGGYLQEFNTIDMAAQAGTPNDRGGSRDNFEGFVPEFDGTNRDLNIQGYRLLAAISAMHTNGIDIPRSEVSPALLKKYGVAVEGDPIHIDVNMPANSLSENTVVQRGRKNSTIGDLTGLTRARRSLPRQLELLNSLGTRAHVDNVSVAVELKKDKEKNPTADAALTGLESFALRAERTTSQYYKKPSGFAHDALLDKHVVDYITDLNARIANSEMKARSRRDADALYSALSDEVITPTLVRTAVDVLEDSTIEDETNAVDQIRIDLALEAQGNKELIETLMAFRDGTMRQWEINQEAFNQEPASGDTADQQLDAFQKAGGRTPMFGIDRQNDALVRRNTPMTVQHETNMLESLPTPLRAKFHEQVQGQPEQLRLDMEMPFSFDGRMYLSIEHAWLSYGSPAAEKGEVGTFNQQQYDSYQEEHATAQAELAERTPVAPEATRGPQTPPLSPATEPAKPVEHPVIPTDVATSRPGWSRELFKALAEATTPEQLATIRAAAVAGLPANGPEVAGIDQTIAERRAVIDAGPVAEIVAPEVPLPEQQEVGPAPVNEGESEPIGTVGQEATDIENENIRDAVEGDGTLRRVRGKVADREHITLAGTDKAVPIAGEFTLFGETFVIHRALDDDKKWTVSHKATRRGLGVRGRTSISVAHEDGLQVLQGAGREAVKKVITPEQEQKPKQKTEEKPAQKIEQKTGEKTETNAEKVRRLKQERQKPEPKPKPKQAKRQVGDKRAGETNAAYIQRKRAERQKAAPKQSQQTETNAEKVRRLKQEQTKKPEQKKAETNAEKVRRLKQERAAPPQKPPNELEEFGEEPPPPPPNNEAQAKFLAIVKRLLGDRAKVEFNAKGLGEGVAGEWVNRFGQTLEDTGAALKVVQEQRREELRALKKRRNATQEEIDDEKVDPRTPQQIEESIKGLMAQEQDYLNDLAVRGTIRVATGMEAQAGLAEHEAFHAAFEFFFGDNNAADRKVITTAFTQGVLAKRLQKYFAGNEEVLAVIDPKNADTFSPEEAAAYAFQIFLHEPGALQMGQKVEGIFNRFLAYLQRLVGYKTYEERAQTIFNDLNSGRRAERGTSVLRDRVGMEESMLDRSQEFVRGVGTGFMHMYDTVLSSTYSRLEGSGNAAMAQIARLGYNETGQEGNGMLQAQRQATTKWSNRLKEALHALDTEELNQINRAMMLNEELTGKLGQAQKRLRSILADVHEYQTMAGVEMGFLEDYFPMIWNPEKVTADYDGFIKMLMQPKYAAKISEMNQTPTEVADAISSFAERGHEFQGVFGRDGEPVADSANRRSLGFIENEDRVAFMEDDLVVTMAHYLNQAVRHAEYVRAYGQNGARLKQLMDEVSSVYGGSKADIDLVQDYIDGLMGNKEVGMSRELKDLYGAATVYQNVRLLPLSVFSSLVDPLGIAVRTNNMNAVFDTFAYSMRNLFTDFRNDTTWTPDQWAQYAADMGTIDMSGTVKSIDKIYTGVTLRGKTRAINDGFFKWNLLNGWVKNNHIGATKAAQLFLRRSSEGMFGDEQSAENLQEVGVNPEDIVYDETLGRIKSTAPEILGYENVKDMELKAEPDDITAAREQADRIQQAIHKIVRQSMIQPSTAEMPSWMSNPYLAPIAHLKTFVFGFNATILQRLMHEAKRGNYNPIYYATAYVPGMIAADFIKGFAGNGGEEPEWKKNWSLGDYTAYGVERSGLMGTSQFFADMNNDVSRGGGGFKSLSGPSIEQGMDLMSAMNAKTSQPTATWMTNALPANALYDQWMRDN